MALLEKWFFNRIKSAYLHGVAFKKMELREFANAVKIFKELIDIEDGKTSAHTYQSLGHCYLNINNDKE